MTDEITSPGETVTPTDTTPAADSTAGQGSVEGTPEIQPTEGQPKEEETFFDPKQVPDALKPAYKLMQAAFTKKTQSLAEQTKATEAFKAKAEAYAKYEQYIPVLEEMLKGNPAGKPSSPELTALEQRMRSEGYSEDAINLAKLTGDTLLSTMRNSQENDRISRGIKEAADVDPRLNDKSLTYQTDTGESVTYGTIVENLVLSDPKWREDPVAATKRAIARVDALIGKSKTEGKDELSNAAKSKANKFQPNTSSPQSTVSTEQPKTIKEAAAQAKQQLGM